MNTKAPGRPKGSVNRNVVNARRAIADFVESNIPRFNTWLDQVANGIPAKTKAGQPVFDSNGSIVYLVKPDPLSAMKIVADITEYHLPKLSRQDVQITGAVAHVSELSDIGQAMISMSTADLEKHLQSLTLADQMPPWLVPQTGDTIDAEAVLVPQDEPHGDE